MSRYFGRFDFAQSQASPHHEQESGGGKPCKACTAFKDWAKKQGETNPVVKVENHDDGRNDCPLDKDELGRSTWGFLHTMAAYFPDKPTEEQRKEMKCFFNIFAKYYPCQVCAEHLRKELVTYPPVTNSAEALSKWLCGMHNKVNVRLGKPEFDCSRVLERWRDGWKDGSCD